MNRSKLLTLVASALLMVTSQAASAHPESRARIGLGLSLFFPHVGLHIGTSTGGGHHHHQHDSHHVDGQHRSGHHQSSTHAANQPTTHRAGPRSKRGGTSQHYQTTSATPAANRSNGHYCQQANADPIHCLSQMQSR